MILDKHWWWTADRTRVVPDGDPDAAFLAWAKGHEVADMVARSYGMLPDESEDDVAEVGATEQDNKADENQAEEKAKPAPANKARAKAGDKAGGE